MGLDFFTRNGWIFHLKWVPSLLSAVAGVMYDVARGPAERRCRSARGAPSEPVPVGRVGPWSALAGRCTRSASVATDMTIATAMADRPNGARRSHNQTICFLKNFPLARTTSAAPCQNRQFGALEVSTLGGALRAQ